MEYQLINGNRTSLAIQITEEGNVVVRAPKKYTKRKVEQYIQLKWDWINKKIQQKNAEAWYINLQPFEYEERAQYMEQALETFSVKAEYYADLIGVTYHQIRIMERRTQWGSCSKKGRLSFNWRLMLAPDAIIDYVVVLVLAQLKNYPFRSYEIVEDILPDYQQQAQWLKENTIILWGRK